MKTPEELVDAVIHAFYHEHHSVNTFRSQLVKLTTAKTTGFFEAKRRIVRSIDSRISKLKSNYRAGLSIPETTDRHNCKSRIDELTALRIHVKGMVTKA